MSTTKRQAAKTPATRAARFFRVLHRKQREQTVEQRRPHSVAARETLARQSDQRILQNGTLSMEKMFEDNNERAAADHR